tara:strand:+ start:888 stop:1115 length:228 start_codon:yes stop_codon:yes gene_type:complete
MKNFISDLFRESTGGKTSSKKFWGNAFLLLCGITYILDGFHFYEVSMDLFNPTLIAGCTLIGLRTVGGMFSGGKA